MLLTAFALYLHIGHHDVHGSLLWVVNPIKL